MPPHQKFRLSAPLAALLLATLALGGCAYAPGVHVSSQVQQPDTPVEAIPPGALIRITPSLVKELRAVPETNPAVELAPFLVEPQQYRIGPGDQLNVLVWGSTEFSSPGGSGGQGGGQGSGPGFTVNARGFIQVPYIGNVKAEGLTEDELRDSLQERLQSQLRRPQVTVSVQTYRSARIYVDGEVRTPGQQVLNDVPMTLPEALNRAGGLTANADRSAVTIARGLKTVNVNLEQLVRNGIDPLRLLLAKGDTVRVPSTEDSRVYVLGEVSSAGPKPLRKGRLSLYEALGDAGGISQISGDPRQVYVVRVVDPLKPEIYHLDATSPVALALADGFLLKPRDVVYVDPVPLVRWNRVINLILPSASALTVTNQAVGNTR